MVIAEINLPEGDPQTVDMQDSVAVATSNMVTGNMFTAAQVSAS